MLTLLVVGTIAYRAIVLSSESSRWARHSREILVTLQNLRAANENIDSDTWGLGMPDFPLKVAALV